MPFLFPFRFFVIIVIFIITWPGKKDLVHVIHTRRVTFFRLSVTK